MPPALPRNGAAVAVADIDIERARATAAALPDAIALEMDVRDEAAVRAGVAATLARWGRLDILVNNAGVNTLAHRVTVEAFPTGGMGPHRLGRPRRDVHREPDRDRADAGARRGRVINIASVVGLVPLRLQSPFVAAKAGVVNLTKSMALELGPRGVLVNAVCPGLDADRGHAPAVLRRGRAAFSARARDLLAHIPLGRPGEVDEIANAVLFLADPDSSYVNGHVMVVDGGWIAGSMM